MSGNPPCRLTMDVITLTYQRKQHAPVMVAHAGSLLLGVSFIIGVVLGGAVAAASSNVIAMAILAATIVVPLSMGLVKRGLRYARYASILMLVSFWPSLSDFAIPTPLGKLPPIIPAVVLLFALAVFRSMAVHRRAVMTLQKTTIPVLEIGAVFFFWYLAVGCILSPTLTTAKMVVYVGVGSIGVLLLAATDPLVSGPPLKWAEVLAIVVGLVSVLGIAEFLTGWNPFLPFFERPTWTKGHLWRTVSTVGNPLVFAAYLLLAIPALYHLSHHRTWLGIPALVLTITAMLLTFSRSAYIALIVVLMVMLGFPVASTGRNVRFRLTVVFMLIVALVLLVWSATRLDIRNEVVQRFLLRNNSVSSLIHRRAAWGAIGEMIFKHPFGVGPSNLNAELVSHPSLSFSFGMMIGTYDDAFLDMIGEVGLIGAVLYSAFILSPALVLLTRRGNSEVVRDSIAVTIAYIIMSFSFTTYFFPPTWVTYWWIQGALLNDSIRGG